LQEGEQNKSSSERSNSDCPDSNGVVPPWRRRLILLGSVLSLVEK
jgi:hypothetical protein